MNRPESEGIHIGETLQSNTNFEHISVTEELENNTYDIHNLRNDASFQLQVSRGLYWVPVCSTGNSRHTNEEIKGWVGHMPATKKMLGLNLFESIQLLYLSDFRYEAEFKPIQMNGVTWEFHKPAYETIVSNRGNCAAICAWIKHMCAKAYEHAGFLHYIHENGLGHVVNYFIHKGVYYIVDITAMLRASAGTMCVENGAKSEFRKCRGDFPVCLMTEDLEHYVAFNTKIQRLRGHDVRHFLIDGHDYVPPASVQKEEWGITLRTSYSVQQLDRCDTIGHCEVSAPAYEPKWNE